MTNTDSEGANQAAGLLAFEPPTEVWRIIIREATTMPASIKYPSPMIHDAQLRATREEKQKYYQSLVRPASLSFIIALNGMRPGNEGIAYLSLSRMEGDRYTLPLRTHPP